MVVGVLYTYNMHQLTIWREAHEAPAWSIQYVRALTMAPLFSHQRIMTYCSNGSNQPSDKPHYNIIHSSQNISAICAMVPMANRSSTLLRYQQGHKTY